jgi:hypothetical protein
MLSPLADNATSPPAPRMMKERRKSFDDGLEDGDGLYDISDGLQC